MSYRKTFHRLHFNHISNILPYGRFYSNLVNTPLALEFPSLFLSVREARKEIQRNSNNGPLSRTLQPIH